MVTDKSFSKQKRAVTYSNLNQNRIFLDNIFLSDIIRRCLKTTGPGEPIVHTYIICRNAEIIYGG